MKCLSCGWKVVKSDPACARCTFVTMKLSWATEARVREQLALNPGMEMPSPPVKTTMEDRLRTLGAIAKIRSTF